MKQSDTDYDVMILGAGSAGLAAGVYTVREGVKTLILERGIPEGMAAIMASRLVR